MVLIVLLAVVCLASMFLSATSITRKEGRCAVMPVQQKWTPNTNISPFWRITLEL